MPKEQDSPNLLNLEGGVLSWLHAGSQLFDRNGATRCVHVYGPKWALQPAAYQPAFKESD